MLEGDEAVGGPVAEEPLHLRGPAHAAACVGAQRDVEPGVGGGAGAPARGAGRRVLVAVAARVERLVIVDPVGGCGFTVGELRGDHLADDDGARVDEVLHWGCGGVGGRVEPVPGSVAVGCAQAFDVVDVFDADADSG